MRGPLLVSMLVIAMGAAMLPVDALGHRGHRAAVGHTIELLRSRDFKNPEVSCKAGPVRGHTCRWSAIRGGLRFCRGVATVTGPRARRPNRARIRRARCDDRTIVGFNENPSPSGYRRQSELGADVRRMPVPWKDVEPVPGGFAWDQYDRIYRDIVSNGLRPLLVAYASPCWASPGTKCAAVHDGPPDPAFDQFWSRYVRELAARYPEAVAVEVWNEQNFLPHFQPEVDPARYTELLKQAYRAVNDVNSRMAVVSGGLLASPLSGPDGIADYEFLEAMYRNGAAGFMDGIGIHPYPITLRERGTSRYDPNVVTQTLDRLRAVRDAAGDNSPLWVTEVGASTQTGPGYPPALTEEEQSRMLIGLMRGFVRAEDVATVLIHRLIDPPRDPALGTVTEVTTPYSVSVYYPIEAGFGVHRTDGTPKAAACAIARELGGSLVC